MFYNCWIQENEKQAMVEKRRRKREADGEKEGIEEETEPTVLFNPTVVFSCNLDRYRSLHSSSLSLSYRFLFSPFSIHYSSISSTPFPTAATILDSFVCQLRDPG